MLTPRARDGDTERGGRKGAGRTNLIEVVGRDAGEVEPRGGGRDAERGDGQRRRRRARDRHGNGRSSGGDARSASARGRSEREMALSVCAATRRDDAVVLMEVGAGADAKRCTAYRDCFTDA
jgi:hypothetical protein